MKNGTLTVDLRITSNNTTIYDEDGESRARNMSNIVEAFINKHYPNSENTVERIGVSFEEEKKPQPRYRAEKSGELWSIQDTSQHNYPTVMRVSEHQAKAIADLLNSKESAPPPSPSPKHRARRMGDTWVVENEKGQVKVFDVTNYMANYLAAYFNGEARIVVNA